jgi:hypothetical protein
MIYTVLKVGIKFYINSRIKKNSDAHTKQHKPPVKKHRDIEDAEFEEIN